MTIFVDTGAVKGNVENELMVPSNVLLSANGQEERQNLIKRKMEGNCVS